MSVVVADAADVGGEWKRVARTASVGHARRSFITKCSILTPRSLGLPGIPASTASSDVIIGLWLADLQYKSTWAVQS